MNKKKSIDKVTTQDLDMVFRLCEISVPIDIVDNIIDIVELLEEKGDKTTLKDVCKLQEGWKMTF
jgi:hypothetical protein